MCSIHPTKRANLFSHFCDLVDLADSFDQLTKVALILDSIYSPKDPEHKALYKFVELQCKYLKGKRDIGASENKSPYPCPCWPDCDPGFKIPF